MMYDVNVTEKAVIDAKKFSDDTKEALEKNLRILETEIEPELRSWNDTHVLRYLRVSDEITQAIRGISQNLEKISVYCVEEYRWIIEYKET